MATSSHAPRVGAATRNRARTRRDAASAMHLAARSLGVQPTALTATAYRTFRTAHADADLPSSLTISLLYAGWQHACEIAVALTCDDAEVEAEVMRTLYGDPSCRHRAHRTRPRLQARRL